MCALYILLNNESSEVIQIISFKNVTTTLFILITGPLVILMSISTLLVVKVVNPLALNVAGDLKNVAVVLFSYLIFRDVNLGIIELSGLSLNFIGGSL